MPLMLYQGRPVYDSDAQMRLLIEKYSERPYTLLNETEAEVSEENGAEAKVAHGSNQAALNRVLDIIKPANFQLDGKNLNESLYACYIPLILPGVLYAMSGIETSYLLSCM